MPRAAYKADGRVREIERDVAKRWLKQNIRIGCVGLENQTKPDLDMPLKVIAYDGAEYRAQLNGDGRYPVVTLVLYFGYKKYWDQPTNLINCFDIPKEFRPYVRDYEITMCEVLDRIEKKGKAEGRLEGMNVLSALINRLIELGRNDDISKVTTDAGYRDQLIAELIAK